jgi:hypothetical protein
VASDYGHFRVQFVAEDEAFSERNVALERASGAILQKPSFRYAGDVGQRVEAIVVLRSVFQDEPNVISAVSKP